MVSKRDTILELVNYIESSGVKVNLCKNKARGNKGFFKVKESSYRIDISNHLSEDEIVSVLIHEFMHFVHYKYDKSLKSLDFILNELDDDLLEELIKITVELIPKSEIEPLFKKKEEIKNSMKTFPNGLNNIYLKKMLNNINSKISRLNKYYNSPTELMARSWEYYFTNKEGFKNTAPLLVIKYDNIIKNNKIPELTKMINILINS